MNLRDLEGDDEIQLRACLDEPEWWVYLRAVGWVWCGLVVGWMTWHATAGWAWHRDRAMRLAERCLMEGNRFALCYEILRIK